MIKHAIHGLLLPGLLLALSAKAAFPEGVLARGVPRFVRLYCAAALADLENENRIKELCPSSMGAPRKAECEKTKLSPKSWRIPLYEKPDPGSKELGSLVLTAAPGKGLSYRYEASPAKNVQFVPDLFDADWGYGPYADHTILRREGDWVLLPARPFPGPVWVNLKTAWGESPDVYEPVEIGAVYTWHGRTIVIRQLLEEGLLASDAAASDGPCSAEEETELPRTVPASKPFKIPWASLYDREGHWILDKAFLRGC